MYFCLEIWEYSTLDTRYLERNVTRLELGDDAVVCSIPYDKRTLDARYSILALQV